MKVKIISFIIAIVFLLPSFLYAADFGLVLNVMGGYGNPEIEENEPEIKTDLWTYFSTLVGDNGEFIATAGFTLGSNEEFYHVPEILHTEFTMRFGASGIRVGRFTYIDPLAFIASGLFDGIQYSYNSSKGIFSIGAWYTGLLYKKNVNITMTSEDMEEFGKPFDYSDFFNTYFAPRRAFAAFGWEHPSVGELVHLNSAVIAQIDFTNADSKYNNQYIILKAGMPVNNLLFELGGSIELSQVSGEKNDNSIALAGLAGFSWLFPGEYNSRLSFTGRIAGGVVDGFCDAFVPITTKYYGYVLKHKLSGLSVMTLDYSKRFNNAIGASFTTSYFIRNDLGTYLSYPVDSNNNGYFLGPDFSARATWSPASDLQFNLSGGTFLPALGNAGRKEKAMWRVELSATMAIF